MAADGFRIGVFDAIDQIGDAPLSWPVDEDGSRKYVLRRFPFSVVLDQLSSQGAMSLGDLERHFPEINRCTLQRDIKGMVDKGLLREVGTGPTDPNRHYVPGKL